MKKFIMTLLAIIFCWSIASAEEFKSIQWKIDDDFSYAVRIPIDMPNFFGKDYDKPVCLPTSEWLAMCDSTKGDHRITFTIRRLQGDGEGMIDVIYDSNTKLFWLIDETTGNPSQIDRDYLKMYGNLMQERYAQELK